MHKTRMIIGLLLLLPLNIVFFLFFGNIKTSVIGLNLAFLNLSIVFSFLVMSVKQAEHVLEKNFIIPSSIYMFASVYLGFSSLRINLEQTLIFQTLIISSYVIAIFIIFNVNKKIASDLDKEQSLTKLRKQVLEKLALIKDFDSDIERMIEKYKSIPLSNIESNKENIIKSLMLIDEQNQSINKEEIDIITSLLDN